VKYTLVDQITMVKLAMVIYQFPINYFLFIYQNLKTEIINNQLKIC